MFLAAHTLKRVIIIQQLKMLITFLMMADANVIAHDIQQLNWPYTESL